MRGIDDEYWYPNSDGTISSTGGSISETDTSFAGSYTCTVTAYTAPNSFYDDSFTFSLSMSQSLLTVPDPPTALTETTASITFT